MKEIRSLEQEVDCDGHDVDAANPTLYPAEHPKPTLNHPAMLL